MRTTWKYTITVGPGGLRHEIKVPLGAKFLTLRMKDPIDQHNFLPRDIDLWYEVETDNQMTVRQFSITGTGTPIPPDGLYMGTIIPIESLVFHIWETFDLFL